MKTLLKIIAWFLALPFALLDTLIIFAAQRRKMFCVDQRAFSTAVATVQNLHTYAFTSTHVTRTYKRPGTARGVQVKVKKKFLDGLQAARTGLYRSVR